MDAPPDEMDALIAYLATLGKAASDTKSAATAEPARAPAADRGESAIAKMHPGGKGF